VAEYPQVPQYRRELAGTHNNMGNLLQITGRAADAEKAYRQALQLQERLVAEHPQVPEYRQDLASAHAQQPGPGAARHRWSGRRGKSLSPSPATKNSIKRIKGGYHVLRGGKSLSPSLAIV
jgi:hypothetical protein